MIEPEIGTWNGEGRLERLDRCRRFLFGQQIITTTVNDAIRSALEDARERQVLAEEDALDEGAPVGALAMEHEKAKAAEEET